MAPIVLVRFGDCVFDREARTLTRAGRRVDLAPKAFELLDALIEARPKALSQTELRDRLWPSTHVAYTSLARVVSELRKAIGDARRDAKQIRTVHRFGYAFGAMAADAPSDAGGAFRLVRGSEEIPLRAGENLLGRGPECRVLVDSDRVSRRHARIVVDDAGATLEDLGSKNGTYLDGRRINGTVTLRAGNLVGVGPAALIFRDASSQGTTHTDTGTRSNR